jgi:hypothetical protein
MLFHLMSERQQIAYRFVSNCKWLNNTRSVQIETVKSARFVFLYFFIFQIDMSMTNTSVEINCILATLDRILIGAFRWIIVMYSNELEWWIWSIKAALFCPILSNPVLSSSVLPVTTWSFQLRFCSHQLEHGWLTTTW